MYVGIGKFLMYYTRKEKRSRYPWAFLFVVQVLPNLHIDKKNTDSFCL